MPGSAQAWLARHARPGAAADPGRCGTEPARTGTAPQPSGGPAGPAGPGLDGSPRPLLPQRQAAEAGVGADGFTR